MRLWSLHPKYLDAKGLVALWREGLLAQHVLLGKTKGYRAHPQLLRFRETQDPVAAIGCYLREVVREAEKRGYTFDATKIAEPVDYNKLHVARGQMAYEWTHLLNKLEVRAPELYENHKDLSSPKSHPLFKVVAGGIADWEKT